MLAQMLVAPAVALDVQPPMPLGSSDVPIHRTELAPLKPLRTKQPCHSNEILRPPPVAPGAACSPAGADGFFLGCMVRVCGL